MGNAMGNADQRRKLFPKGPVKGLLPRELFGAVAAKGNTIQTADVFAQYSTLLQASLASARSQLDCGFIPRAYAPRRNAATGTTTRRSSLGGGTGEEAGAVAVQDAGAVAAQNLAQTTLTQNEPEHFRAHGRREVANRAALAAAEEAAAGGGRTMVQTTLTQAARRGDAGLAMLGRLLHADFVPENVDAAAAAVHLREESQDERTPPPTSPPEARGSGGHVDDWRCMPFKPLVPKCRR